MTSLAGNLGGIPGIKKNFLIKVLVCKCAFVYYEPQPIPLIFYWFFSEAIKTHISELHSNLPWSYDTTTFYLFTNVLPWCVALSRTMGEENGMVQIITHSSVLVCEYAHL